MSCRKKSIIISSIIYIVLIIIANFITFNIETKPEFIEIDFAQASPFSPETEEIAENDNNSEDTKKEKTESDIEQPVPKTQPKETIESDPKPIKKNTKQNEKQINKPKDTPTETKEKEKVNLPKRDFVTQEEDTEEMTEKKEKDLPPPTENFDKMLTLNKPNIKDPQLERYEVEQQEEAKGDTTSPDITPTNKDSTDDNNKPSGGILEDGDGDKKAEINFDIEGTIRNRKILRRPEINPELVTQNAKIKIKIIVTPDGYIESYIPLQKGGYLEKIAMDNLRKWKFEQLDSEQTQENQSGVVTFNFIIK